MIEKKFAIWVIIEFRGLVRLTGCDEDIMGGACYNRHGLRFGNPRNA
jgi:hypothetical protein